MNPDLGDLMKQAQQMQEQFQKKQQELANTEVTGESGAGMVKIIMTGRYDVRNVTIDQSLMSEDKEMLEDLLAAAVNDAVRRIESLNKNNMAKMVSGFGIPPDFKMPF